ncbi:MAG: CobW family GTP-binding protein [Rhizobiaceae bacterium]
MTPKLPVTVIGGYLGSGKTTLVNHLLRNANGLRLAILVNEFGELAIDEDLIEAEEDDLISIAGGCICCSFGSDLTAALMDMATLDPRPDHVLIESSGVAIPSSIVNTVRLLDTFSTDGIVVLADAETIQQGVKHKYMGDTIERQLSDANIIVLNKTDLVNSETRQATKSWLNTEYDQASIVETTQGKAPPEVVLASFLERSHEASSHLETTQLDMFTLRPATPIDVEVLAKTLAEGNLGIIRAKGFATALDGEKILVQVVGKRWEISPATGNPEVGIVCLGFKETLNREILANIANHM